MRAFVAFHESDCRGCDSYYECFIGVFSSLEDAQKCPNANEVREMDGAEELQIWYFTNGAWAKIWEK